MPNTRSYTRAFSGGVMSPEMFGRIDDVKFQTGAAKLRNFIAMPQGPAQNRPGFSYVREVKASANKTRLIPFTYSTTQTMVLEFGNGYIRFHTQGATLLVGSTTAYKASVTATMTIASPCVVTSNGHGYSDGDLVVFTTTGALPTGLTAGTPYFVVSAATNTFRVSATSGGTAINTSGSQSGTHTLHKYYDVGALVSYSGSNYYCQLASYGNLPTNTTYWYAEPATGEYEIPTPYSSDDVFDLHHVQSADVLTIVHPNYAPRELRRLSATTWQLTTISFGATIQPPTGISATPYIGANTVTYTYVVTSIAADGITESTASSAYNAGNNLFTTGAYNLISWSAMPGASRYRVYKLVSGIYGYIGETDGLSIKDENVGPDLSVTPPKYETVFQSAGNYPAAVSYFEQRRAFAGTTNEPQKIWMTKSGTESNMSYSLPIADDDRIAFRVAAREANTIRHIVPLTQLILLTGSAEWRVSSVNSDAITPTSISVRPQSYIGASNVQPVIVNNSLVYAAARGGHIRELGYSWQSNGFITGDLSIRAAHMFDGYEISDMCFSKAPQPLIWFVSSSGGLLGLTYIPEQQIGAWHHHDTDGVFESCTCVAEGNEDVLYVIVKRLINGSYVRYVERMESRAISTIDKCFFVDSGATYNGTNTTAVTMTVTGGTTWGPADTLTITSSSAKFTGSGDIGDAIILTDSAGTMYKLTIVGYTSSTVVTARVDKTLPAALRSTATTVWNFARNAISGLSWLEGKTVSILADGAVHPQRVVTSGAVSLEVAANIVTIGLPYESDLQTLPLALQIDGFGQGRYKNVNKAWLRVYKSSGIFVGPDENNLVEAKQRSTEPYGSPPALKSDEIMVMLTPTWAASGQVYIRQTDPLPLNIVGLTVEVAIGG
jgi:hypothetical protein